MAVYLTKIKSFREKKAMEIVKKPYYRYDNDVAFEGAKGCLRIYIPTDRGYVNFNIVHSVSEADFADVYRLGKAFAYDDNFSGEFELTPGRAEWDMAIKIDWRDDFIGGLVHGDEISGELLAVVDGDKKDIISATELTPFTEMILSVDSIGYDPADHTTKALIHTKIYTVNSNGITLKQRVEFLGDYSLKNSYLAMMPPSKTHTDAYLTDINHTPTKIEGTVKDENVKSVTVFGTESGISFTMRIPEYPALNGGNQLFIQDNGGRSYNKMYFPVCTDAKVKLGDVWNSVTEYEIKIK